jgi:hypothetical protein
VERRFSLTAREREQELLEQAKPPPAPTNASGDAAAEEEEEERIYNPLKLPLGWDGKPIPYWLYKLHGLGVEYRCEICSDHVYMGRYINSFYLRRAVQKLISLQQEKFRPTLPSTRPSFDCCGRLNIDDVGIKARFWHASSGFAEHKTFPRNYSN